VFGISWENLLVLIVAGLFILGPERLPGAAAWLAKSIRQVRDYANGAREQLRTELGPEFDDLRKPLDDLRELRNFDPKRAITKHLLDDINLDEFKPNGFASTPSSTPPSSPPSREQQKPLSPGERPPFDPDAT
jgi:sec-independent protein translocase protein TatB